MKKHHKNKYIYIGTRKKKFLNIKNTIRINTFTLYTLKIMQ